MPETQTARMWTMHPPGITSLVSGADIRDEDGRLIAEVADGETAARIVNAAGEIERLRSMLAWCAEQVWEGFDTDGGSFQDEMEKRGLMVPVPASQEIREEYECDTMLVLAWAIPDVATPAETPHE